MTAKTKTLKLLAIVVPVAVSLCVLFFLVETRSKPTKRERPKIARQVRVIDVKATDLLPRTRAYGSVQPARTWQAVPQVKGKIRWLHPNLKKGGRIAKDDIIVEIDPAEYQLSMAQAEANIQNIREQIKKLGITEANNRSLLKIEQKNLKLRKKELVRQKNLLLNKLVAQSVYEKEQQTYFTQQYKVQLIENTLKSISSDRKLLKTQMKQSELQLQSAKLQLSYTRINSPFDGVVAKSKVEQWQYIQPGQVIAEIEVIDVVEIEAQLNDGKHLFYALGERSNQYRHNPNSKNMGQRLGISAVVRSESSGNTEWKGVLLRTTANIDPQTRTPSVVIQVTNDQPTATTEGPPFLIKGMYCEVELTGELRNGLIAVPNSSVHGNNTLYILNGESRLEKRRVEIWFSQENLTIVKSGIQSGEQLVVTDLIPAVEGMLLEPVADVELMATIASQAKGGAR